MKQFNSCILLGVLLTGCASTPTFDETLDARVIPQTQEQVRNECKWIRKAISKQQSYINSYSGAPTSNQYGINLGAIYAQVAPTRIASLESRASNIGCRAAFSNQTNNEQSKIKQCISACKENTTMKSEACFNTCNK